MARRLKAHDPTKRPRRKAEPVVTTQMAHPRIWATAIKLADGNMTRIKVVNFCNVTVIIP